MDFIFFPREDPRFQREAEGLSSEETSDGGLALARRPRQSPPQVYTSRHAVPR